MSLELIVCLVFDLPFLANTGDNDWSMSDLLIHVFIGDGSIFPLRVFIAEH